MDVTWAGLYSTYFQKARANRRLDPITFVKYELLANVLLSALTISEHQIHDGRMLFELLFRRMIL